MDGEAAMSRTVIQFWLLLLLVAGPAAAGTAEFEAAAARLTDRSFQVKQSAVEHIAASGDSRSLVLLQALLDGRLRFTAEDATLVLIDDQSGVTTALTGEPMAAEPGTLKRIVLNNTLRSTLRTAIATLSLGAESAAVRLAAVRRMTAGLDDAGAELLQARLGVEESAAVRAAIETALALRALESGDDAIRLAAIEQLGSSLEPIALVRLRAILDSDAAEQVRQAALRSLKGIEFRRKLSGLAETLFFGLSLGSVLVLAAIGLAITFGVMGVINMAHGELIMIGAYTTYVVQLLMPNHIGLSILVAIPAAFTVAALVGIAIERGVIRFLYGRPLETLLATFGISLVLQQAVRSIFSPLNRSVQTPEWMSGTIEINAALSLTLNRLYIIAFCLLVFAALVFILKKTPLGLQVRAVSQNRAMARAMGVRSQWVDALTFGLGSGIAGVAGVALSQLTNVGPNLGQAYIIDSFMVVVFGGVGNLWGTLIAGLSLGVANKVMEPWAGAVLAKILVLLFIILFIQKRPRGLFPQKGRAAEA